MLHIRTARNGQTTVLLGAVLCLLLGQGALGEISKRPACLDAVWDAQRYIKVSEIKPGMPAYCLTDYGENGIEKFEMKVLDVVYGIRDLEPGRSSILVMGMDERFKHTGLVAGCSGSPVFIDGRLAGALAWGYTFSKDPLYGVTPIEEMLEVGEVGGPGTAGGASQKAAALTFDLSKPIDLAEIDKELTARKVLASSRSNGPAALPCPLLISGLPGETCPQLTAPLEALGFMAVSSPGGAVSTREGETALKPGGTIAIPMVTGDIRMSAFGTVTEVRGDRVYGFGHSVFGGGPTNLPMAGGKVYTVVSNVVSSFKMATCSDIVGAITCDQSGAVVGRVGEKPKMIPLMIHCERFNALEPCSYNCQVAYHQELTPVLVRAAIMTAGLRGGPFPPNHTVEYNTAIDLDDGRSIHFANTSSNSELGEPGVEIAGSLALLMNNPFRVAEIKGLRFDVARDAEEHRLLSLVGGGSQSEAQAGRNDPGRGRGRIVPQGEEEVRDRRGGPGQSPARQVQSAVSRIPGVRELLAQVRAVPVPGHELSDAGGFSEQPAECQPDPVVLPAGPAAQRHRVGARRAAQFARHESADSPKRQAGRDDSALSPMDRKDCRNGYCDRR